MSDHLIADGSFINSIVGEGTRFRGELDLNGLLRIDGDYSGTIRTPGKVLVGKNGRAECTIKAGTVVIGGVVKGNVFSSEKVIILSTGMIIGNVSSPRLIVEEGVVVNGNCIITKTQKEQPIKSENDNSEGTEQHPYAENRNNGRSRDDADRAYSLSKKNSNDNNRKENKKELSAWKG